MKNIFSKENRRYVWIFSVLIVAIGGIRFSDGSALLAIAQGATAESPLFSGSGALQYIWDSPLKVLSLRYVPPNIYGVGLFFGFLSVLPVALLLTRDTLLFWLFEFGINIDALPQNINAKYRRWRWSYNIFSYTFMLPK